MAPRWSRPSAEGRCREDGAEEGIGCDAGFEDQGRSPPSQASASRPSTGNEEQESVRSDGEGRRILDAVGNPHPEGVHRRLKLHCVTHDTMVQQFVMEAIVVQAIRAASEPVGTTPSPTAPLRRVR